MRSLLLVLVVVLALSGPALAREGPRGKASGVPPETQISPAQPRLEVEQSSIDIGVVSEGEEAVGTFILRNVGEKELKILKAKPG
jgi:hypothetical protein